MITFIINRSGKDCMLITERTNNFISSLASLAIYAKVSLQLLLNFLDTHIILYYLQINICRIFIYTSTHIKIKQMKKLYSLLIIVLFTIISLQGFSQNVGINNDGTAPHTSAMLDVKNPNKGFLAPRVELTGTGDVATIPSAATSLLVFNTSIAGTSPNNVTPGYYYWSGAAWLRLSTASPSWLLTGNANTVDGTNFIGTTDNVPFNIRVFNQKAGRISASSEETFFGYFSGGNNTSTTSSGFGYLALASNTTGAFNTAVGDRTLQLNVTGGSNTAVGHQALRNNIGSENTGIGTFTLTENTTGTNNTASGRGALTANTTGTNNTANGHSALISNITGTNNTASGSGALQFNTTGSNNTALGDGAGVSVGNLTNATAIGNGANVNASNTVQIGNSAVTDVYFGNGTTTRLHGLSTNAFADFYALMPGDNPATVPPGSSVEFPQDGPVNGITRLSTQAFNLPAIGTYEINFQVSIVESGQLVVVLNGVELAYTVVGRAIGTSQITGTCLITNTSANSILRINNPAGNGNALTIAPLAGGTYPVSAHLIIKQLN